MHITKVHLENFRNYQRAIIEPGRTRNILIGDNAQGKSNFLEAIEYASTGRAERASRDVELIRNGTSFSKVNLSFLSEGMKEEIAITLKTRQGKESRTDASTTGISIERQIKVNGVDQSSVRALKRRLITVSFKSHDLNLLRGGPKFRRDWIDSVLVTLKPQHAKRLSQYQKVVMQRNRLLKQIAERGKVTVSDQDQLKAWDIQLARLAAEIIKERLTLMGSLLPEAELFHERLSGARERLSAQYDFKMKESARQDESLDADEEERAGETPQRQPIAVETIAQCETAEVAEMLVRQLKELRYEEIGRRQTLIGPHRDDIRFFLNREDATHFASQGQQRSLVLSLKLAELKAVSNTLADDPVLLLDDVLAELDLTRQGVLMELIGSSMQTFVTTTHVTGFRPEWLEGANFLRVNEGSMQPTLEPVSI